MQYRVLLVEDDISINEMVRDYLLIDGFNVTSAFNGEEAIAIFLNNDFDIVILDIMMPKLDGMEVMRIIREKSYIPILIMSARDNEVDKAVSLGLGADDYITKPFSMIELSARIKAVIRRATKYSEVSENKESEEKIIIHELIIDFTNFSVTKNGNPISITAKEFEILRLFVKNPKRVFTKAQIYSAVWNDIYYGDENVINVHMRRLREKIEDDPSNPRYIKTLWGIGYRLGGF